MSDRRYDEAEVAAIFQRATEGPPALLRRDPRSDGLTLADLQEIGRDVGIAPDVVAEAARAIDRRPSVGERRFLGLPIGVERTIVLDRWVTEAEWEQLVVELREVFSARGSMSATGNFRQWTNGNLQALLEPTATGHRLRLRTYSDSARASISGGLVALGVTAAISFAALVGGRFMEALPGILILFLTGAGLAAAGALRLPGWARIRAHQMEGIIGRLALKSGAEGPAAAERPTLPPG